MSLTEVVCFWRGLFRFYWSNLSTRDLTCRSFSMATPITNVSVKHDISSTCAVVRTCALINSGNLAQVCRSLRSLSCDISSKTQHNFTTIWTIFGFAKKMKMIATACLFQRLAIAWELENSKKTLNFQNAKKNGQHSPLYHGVLGDVILDAFRLSILILWIHKFDFRKLWIHKIPSQKIVDPQILKNT